MATDDTIDFKAISDEITTLSKSLKSDMDDIRTRQETALRRLKDAIESAKHENGDI